MLISPAEAEALVLAHAPLLPAETCALADALGRVLRAPLVADRDLPPHDRATMDGYALASAACANAFAAGRRTFPIAGIAAAGRPALTLTDPLAGIEIMTGAPLPAGADCVVPYEETTRTDDGGASHHPPTAAVGRTGDTAAAAIVATASITLTAAPRPGAHVHRRASDAPRGHPLVAPGVRLTARELAVAASVGAATLTVAARPRVALVSTGDELVAVDAPEVAPHQLRRSNDHALRAALRADGLAGEIVFHHARDDRAATEAALRDALAGSAVVLVTGGVSKGKFDHVPAALATLGVEKKFHGVAQRPGKPLWFGVAPGGALVFALPGNPVSAYTCFARYVRPALAALAGTRPPAATPVTLTSAHAGAGALTLFLPARLAHRADGTRTAEIVAFNTSGDFASLVGTDGFVEIPAATTPVPAGTAVAFRPWD